MRIAKLLLCATCAACVPLQAPPGAALSVRDSLLPGSIGLIAVSRPEGVTVEAVRCAGAAAAAGMRPGDRVVRYNGVAVGSVRELNRLVLRSHPGSRARVEVLRNGTLHVLEIPVHELDVTPRA